MIVRLRIVLAFPAAIMRGLARDPTALFFIILLPIAIIGIVGVAFGGQSRIEVGYAALGDGPVTRDIVATLEDDPALRVTSYDDVDALRRGVRRKDVAAGLLIPADADAAAAAGGAVGLPVMAQTADAPGLAAYIALRGAVAPTNARVVAADVLEDQGAGRWPDMFETARALSGEGRAARPLDVQDVGRSVEGTNRFSLTAPQNLVLFVFTNSMTSAVFIVAARRSGVLRRALATRATPAAVIAGLGAAIFVVALVQTALILAVGVVAFGVRWGDPLAACVLAAAIALAAAAVGVFVGTLGNNADRTAALAPIVGIVTAVIGGCIVPLEIFPTQMLAVARAMPQYWAVTAWQQLVFDGAGLTDIGANVGVLVALTVIAGTASVRLLNRELSRG